MKPRHIAMALALAVAGGLVVFGDNRPDTGVAEAVERKPAPAAAPAVAARSSTTQRADAAIVRLVPREELIGAVGEGSFKSADGVFGGQTWNPPPPPPDAAVNAAPPPPPSAPPLPFQYIGKAAEAGQWEVFLGRGDQTFVVRKGSTIEGTYRVDAIAPPTISITYLPMNQVQQLNIGVIE